MTTTPACRKIAGSKSWQWLMSMPATTTGRKQEPTGGDEACQQHPQAENKSRQWRRDTHCPAFINSLSRQCCLFVMKSSKLHPPSAPVMYSVRVGFRILHRKATALARTENTPTRKEDTTTLCPFGVTASQVVLRPVSAQIVDADAWQYIRNVLWDPEAYEMPILAPPHQRPCPRL
jgi:hypothetical protein